jgi:UMF1 family MFS transporter
VAAPADANGGASTRALLSWALYDWANSAFPTIVQTFVFATYFTRSVAGDPTVGTRAWGTAVGIAAALVAIAGPVLGAVTDRRGGRKAWIGGLTTVCLVASALLWFVAPSPAYAIRGLALLVIASVAFELASLLYNAMLPGLAAPERLGRWSGWGWGLGYAGGLASLGAALLLIDERTAAMLGLDHAASEHVRASFVLVAVWYGLFALPLFLFTPDARGTAASWSGGSGVVAALRDGVRRLVATVRETRRHPATVRFLIAHLCYADGLATLFTFGGVYAAGTFDMTERDVLGFGIALNVTSGLGAAGFAWLDDRLGSKPTIVLSLVGLIVPGTLMLLVASQQVFWVLGMLLGIFVGPAQAASRSYMARVAPPDLRNQLFGLYALSGKATAFVGPLLVGWLTWAAGSQRVGMSAVVVLLAAGLALMLTVPSTTAARWYSEPER